MKKYSLTKTTKVWNGRTLFQIKAEKAKFGKCHQDRTDGKNAVEPTKA